MNEDAWLTNTSSRQLLTFIEARSSPRKLGLFHTACCREFTDGWDESEPARGFLVHVELSLDAELISAETKDQRSSLDHWTDTRSDQLSDLLEPWSAPRWNAKSIALDTVAGMLLTTVTDPENAWWRTTRDIDDPQDRQHYLLTDQHLEKLCDQNIAFLRDIFGNPFRPVAFSPEWQSDTAVSLAKHIYESRDFSSMPILADALQDAGCDHDDILTHCRNPEQVHVRGCWVVDLVLGKT